MDPIIVFICWVTAAIFFELIVIKYLFIAFKGALKAWKDFYIEWKR